MRQNDRARPRMHLFQNFNNIFGHVPISEISQISPVGISRRKFVIQTPLSPEEGSSNVSSQHGNQVARQFIGGLLVTIRFTNQCVSTRQKLCSFRLGELFELFEDVIDMSEIALRFE